LRRPTALTIAGSDSCGGAGIQADIRTMAAFRVHATSAITSITAQNTLGVVRSMNLPPELVAAQIDAIMDDVGADSAKTGMLATAGIIEVVAERIARYRIGKLVVDPVMVATSGARLIEDDAIAAIEKVLIPLALIVTPNVPEAEALSGVGITSDASLEQAARAIHALGARFVLIKGGHLEGEATDLLFDGTDSARFTSRRIGEGKVHGTGCTLSAAIAAALALDLGVHEAVGRAKSFVTRAIGSAFALGGGSDFLDPAAAAEEEVGG
jgi:hydroxymethylpyrimidine/phosphomethylpyrimidine kinase